MPRRPHGSSDLPPEIAVTVRADMVDAEPPIWRRVELPSTLHLDELHLLVQDEGVPVADVRLDEVLAAPDDSLLYAYDYGDGWQVRLVVERVGEPIEQVRCTGGSGAAPPEDSDGIHAWNEHPGTGPTAVLHAVGAYGAPARRRSRSAEATPGARALARVALLAGRG